MTPGGALTPGGVTPPGGALTLGALSAARNTAATADRAPLPM